MKSDWDLRHGKQENSDGPKDECNEPYSGISSRRRRRKSISMQYPEIMIGAHVTYSGYEAFNAVSMITSPTMRHDDVQTRAKLTSQSELSKQRRCELDLAQKNAE